MADFSFLRSDLHENSGRNRTYYRGFNDGKPTVSGGRPLAPLTRRTVRDELIDGNREQERLLKKLMEAYNDIGNGINKKSVVNNGSKLRLPGVSTAPVGGRRKLKKRTNGPPRTSSVSVSSKKSSLRNSNTMLNKKSVPQQQSHPTGPQTLASKKETHRFSKPLWAPKRNALLDKQATARAVRRKLNAKPRLTAADKVLMSLSKESNASGGLRVCLNKMGPKGRGLTLFVMLTENTKITCIGADNTRGLKYQLVMKAGDALIDKKIPEKMHVLHAVAVATKFVEIPQQSRKSKRKAIKKLMGDIGGWGDDLEMQINTEIMVSHMNRPKNLNPRQEMQEMNEKSKQAAKQRAKMANRAIKTRYLAEVERIRKIDEAISKGKKPTLNPDDDDDFDDDDEETFGDNEEDSNASNFNNQFNQKPKVEQGKKSKQKKKRPKFSAKADLKRNVGPDLASDGSEGHPEPLRFRKTDVRVQAWTVLDEHPMLATAVFRPSTAEVIIEARDPELDYQYRLTFKTKVQGEEEEGGGGRTAVTDPEEREQILHMLSSLIPRLKVSGANVSHLGKMSMN